MPLVIDPRHLQTFARDFYMVQVNRHYGTTGVRICYEIIEATKELFRHIEPELVTGKLILFKELPGIGVAPTRTNTVQYASIEFLAQDFRLLYNSSNTLISLEDNGSLVLSTGDNVEIESLSERGIVYLYEHQKDAVVVKGEFVQIPTLSPSLPSVFSIPTFRKLRDALEDYKRRLILTSRCKLFGQAWEGGQYGPRIFFVNSPESKIRDSLEQYLSATLGADTEVVPEFTVDESHPVDIRVSWMGNNRTALIEIKWLGKSRNEEGRITQDFSASRARHGAKQLAAYLDWRRVRGATDETRGYLVVIDARRYGLKPESTSVNRQNGLYFQSREIPYSPEFHKTRPDFDEPIRMFAEPTCSSD